MSSGRQAWDRQTLAVEMACRRSTLPAGAGDRAARRPTALRPAGRGSALPLTSHDRLAPLPQLPQARRDVATAADRTGPTRVIRACDVTGGVRQGDAPTHRPPNRKGAHSGSCSRMVVGGPSDGEQREHHDRHQAGGYKRHVVLRANQAQVDPDGTSDDGMLSDVASRSPDANKWVRRHATDASQSAGTARTTTSAPGTRAPSPGSSVRRKGRVHRVHPGGHEEERRERPEADYLRFQVDNVCVIDWLRSSGSIVAPARKAPRIASTPKVVCQRRKHHKPCDGPAYADLCRRVLERQRAARPTRTVRSRRSANRSSP